MIDGIKHEDLSETRHDAEQEQFQDDSRVARQKVERIRHGARLDQQRGH